MRIVDIRAGDGRWRPAELVNQAPNLAGGAWTHAVSHVRHERFRTQDFRRKAPATVYPDRGRLQHELRHSRLTGNERSPFGSRHSLPTKRRASGTGREA